MPFHGVGIIVGGTIAVLGSGYAFKKLVYDPHLAHLVEAFIAQHPLLHSLSQSSTSPNTETRQRGSPIPVPVSTSATSSARQPNLTQVRRRRSVRERDADGAEMELETRQPLLRAGEREEYYLDANELDDWGKARRATIVVKPGDRGTGGKASPHKASLPDAPSISHSLVDINPERIPHSESTSTHAHEIRSIIFDRDESPVCPSAAASPAVASTSSSFAEAPASLGGSIPSVSRSRPSALSDSWSSAVERMTEGEVNTSAYAFGDTLGDDIHIIRPGTAQRDSYVDAESYTPDEYAERGVSPTRTFPAFPASHSPEVQHQELPTQLTTAAVAQHDGDVAAEMGMSYIRLHAPTLAESASSQGGPRLPRRGPMSVVSLSESEGGRSEDDWEAI